MLSIRRADEADRPSFPVEVTLFGYEGTLQTEALGGRGEDALGNDG